jgi:hypothetical protein
MQSHTICGQDKVEAMSAVRHDRRQ